MTTELTTSRVRRAGGRLDRPQIEADTAIWTIAALSAVTAVVVNDSAPAGLALADAAYRGALAVLVVHLATRARRWTWAVLAAGAAVATGALVGQIAGLIALGAAAGSLGAIRRHRAVGAAIAGVSVPALLAQGAGPFHRLSGGAIDDRFGTSAVITAAVVAPVLVSGWKRTSRHRRRRLRVLARLVGGGAALVAVVTIAVVAFAAPSIQRGLDDTKVASELAADGELVVAAAHFDAAAAEWSAANRLVSGAWMIPSRLLPVLGQHVRATQVITGQASALAGSAGVVADRFDTGALVVDGRIDVAELDSLTPAVDALAATTERADRRLRAADSPWLLPYVSQRLDLATDRLGPISGVAGATAEALRLGVTILSGDDPSTILVMFSTPAEARGAGGFVGSWAEFTATDGRLRLSGQHRSKQLNDRLEARGVELRVAAPDFETRYGRFEIERHIQDVTISPDFPTVARITADLYSQATDTTPDAVLMIDPFAIDVLLEHTGPVEVDGVRLRSGTASEELLRGQYARFEGDEVARETALAELAGHMVATLLREPPPPVAFARDMAPLAEQGRVQLWVAADDGTIVERLGLDGHFPRADDRDVLGVVHQNAGQNKIDTLLHREIDVATTLRTGSEEVVHDVRISLRNEAPATGLPAAVLGSNDQGLEPGTNRMILSLYSPLRLNGAFLDGERVAVETQREFDMNVYSLPLVIGADSSATVEVRLLGDVDLSAGYELVVPAQPLSRPDVLTWRIRRSDGAPMPPAAGWTRDGDALVLDELLRRDGRFLLPIG